MYDFRNDFRDIIFACRFEANHHIMAFETVLTDYHEIVGGIFVGSSMTDRKLV